VVQVILLLISLIWHDENFHLQIKLCSLLQIFTHVYISHKPILEFVVFTVKTEEARLPETLVSDKITSQVSTQKPRLPSSQLKLEISHTSFYFLITSFKICLHNGVYSLKTSFYLLLVNFAS